MGQKTKAYKKQKAFLLVECKGKTRHIDALLRISSRQIILGIMLTFLFPELVLVRNEKGISKQNKLEKTSQTVPLMAGR